VAATSMSRAVAATGPMLTFPSALRIYLAVEPVDMRKQFTGLTPISELRPLSRHADNSDMASAAAFGIVRE